MPIAAPTGIDSRSASPSIAALAKTSSWSRPKSAIPRHAVQDGPLTWESHLRCERARFGQRDRRLGREPHHVGARRRRTPRC